MDKETAALEKPPDGWRLVPNEATEEMLYAVTKNYKQSPTRPDKWREFYRRQWRILLAAAPAVLGPVQRQVRPGAEARWYCIDANGMAQLCANEADANWEVADNTKVFQKNAPYRAVRLVDSREPMTDDEVLKMWRASDFRGSDGQADWFAEGIRAAERAHGIGAERLAAGESCPALS